MDLILKLMNSEKTFIIGFCNTVYKFQGCDIEEHYNIFDVEKIDKKMLYTALSRTTKFQYIHLDNKMLNKYYFIRKQPKREIVNSYFNSDYLNGRIYEIKFDEGFYYVGSTCEII